MDHIVHDYYCGKVSFYTNQLIKLQKRSKLISLFRLLSFILIIVSLVLYTIIEMKIISWILLVMGVVSFGGLLKYYYSIAKEVTLTSDLLEINQNELRYLNHQYTDFYNGSKYENTGHVYASDLNILGHASLFQYVNRTVSVFGEKKLVNALLNPSYDKVLIENKQEANKELTLKNEWNQKFRATGCRTTISESEIMELQEWMREPALFIHKRTLRLAVILFPILAVLSLGFGLYSGFFAFAKLIFIAEIFIILKHSKIINKIHSKLSRKYEVLGNLSELMGLVEKENFKSTDLKQLQSILSGSSSSASIQIKQLSRIMGLFDRRLNVLAAFVLNALYMADLRTVMMLEKWRETNKDNVDRWFDALGQFEVAVSYATFSFNNRDFCYPEISESVVFEAENIGHPLIPESKRVCNDFGISDQACFVILTGANMAGKSTFLRTIGVNLMLGVNGLPVCAKKLLFTPMPLLTSISVKDSLFDNESYFYAELKRLKMIVSEIESGKQVFVVLDEILKGTNSNDKLKGSLSLLTKLVKYNASGIVATHDVALGELENIYPRNIKNRSFEVELDSDRLYYDYKLHVGVCRNLNASFLMKKMGITE